MKRTLYLILLLLTVSPVIAATGEGSYTTNPANGFVSGNTSYSMDVDFTAGSTAYPISGGLISIFFPLGFDPPSASNFYIKPSQSAFLLTGGAGSYSYSAQGVSIQVKNLPASGSLRFLYGYNAGGFSVSQVTPGSSLIVYTDPQSISLTPAVIAAQPTLEVHTPTVTITVSLTPTITPTPSISPTFSLTHTVSPTFTVTPTYTETPVGPAEADKVYAYPNPFDLKRRSFCTFRFPANMPGPVEVQVFNMLAQPVRRLTSKDINAVQGWATWDGRDDQQNIATGGLYLIRVKSASKVLINKFVVYH